MEFSYWERTSFLSSWDVIIVGSGIVGLSTSIQLKEKHPNLKILILEKGHLPQGASTKNAGFACFGSLSELISDLDNSSMDEVLKLVEKRHLGLLSLRKKFGDEGLQYESLGSYEMFKDEEEDSYQKCLEQLLIFNQNLRGIIGPSSFTLSDTNLEVFGFKGVKHLIRNNYEGQLDSGSMMMALITLAQHMGVHIYDGLGLKNYKETDTGVDLFCQHSYQFKTKKLVFATNGFSQKWIKEDVVPARAQVLVTKEIPGLQIKGCFHYDRGYYYFRNVNNRILLGGGRNLDIEGETTTKMETSELIQNSLDDLLHHVILPDQDVEVDYRWSGVMGVGGSKKPIVKKISERTYCGVRLGGMGVAIGSQVGQELADLVLIDS